MGTHFSGPVTSTNGFVGDITGNVTGNVTGNLTGSVTLGSGKTLSRATGSISTLVATSHTVTAQEKISYWVSIPLAGVVGTTGGLVGALLNPEGVPVVVGHVILYKTTQSTGAANLNIGTAANVTTSANNLITAVSAQGTGVADNISDVGASGKARGLLGATDAITVTGTADTTGLVGKLLCEIIIP